MKTHRILIAALCLAPLLSACELVANFDRTKILPPGEDAGVVDMTVPEDLNEPDLEVADMAETDMPVDMNVDDLGIPDVDLGGDDLGPADLGPEDLGPADLGPADLGPADLGPADLGSVDLGTACSVSCDDMNSCTTDSCNLATGLCVHANNTDSCDDGDPCTVGNVCSAGACGAGIAKDCSDTFACTDDSCTPATGVCVHAAKDCSDTNVCTTDSCTAATGVCVHAPNTISCNDGDACTTGDVCLATACHGVAVVCADTNVCTTDSCNPATGGCTFLANTDPCDDLNECTSVDTCGGGSCHGANVLDGTVCNATMTCTAGVCSPP